MHWDALGCTGMHWDALGCIGKHWDAMGCIGIHWDALGCIGMHWDALGCIGMHRDVPGTVVVQFQKNSIIGIVKKIPKEERINLRKAGIKIGRYHIFLPRMLKPNAVNLRVKLWKLFFSQDKKYIIPKFGLNFLKNESKKM